MPNSSPLCVDANIVVRLVTVAHSSPVTTAWRQWRTEGRRFVAPRLLRYEVTNALHRFRRSGDLSDRSMHSAMRTAFDQPIDLYDDEDLHTRALELAMRFNRPASYDSHYLALAEQLGIEFWTLDQRLYNTVRHHLSWVHLAGSSE